jgi:hypothetical protein
MSGLEKATLTKLSNDRSDREEGEPIPVQFNPATLKLTLSNQTEGGQSTGRTQRQYTGNSSTELAFDLVFDTADEDDGSGNPRSVREKTAAVEQFVLSQGSGKGRKSPPRVKFHWGKLIVKGVITSVAIDFELFAQDGTPLRAKMGISIKEQDAKYELLEAGPGSSREGGAPPPGGASAAGPGGTGSGRTDRTGIALGGESVADFALRMGLDPGAWRGLAAGLESTLSLSAGVQIDFDASLSLSAGVGVSAGVEADLGSTLEASLGLEPEGTGSAGSTGSPTSPGFALSAAGGVGAAVETVKIARAQDAARSAARSFGATGVSTSASVATGSAPAAVSGASVAVAPAAPAAPAPGVPSAAPTTYAPPRADGRATSYGFGVPLRPRVGGAAETSQGVVALQPYPRATAVPATRDPTVPAWEQLPATSPALAPQTTRPLASRLGSLAAPPAGSATAAATGTAAVARRGGRGGRGGCGCGQTGRRA